MIVILDCCVFLFVLFIGWWIIYFVFGNIKCFFLVLFEVIMVFIEVVIFIIIVCMFDLIKFMVFIIVSLVDIELFGVLI